MRKGRAIRRIDGGSRFLLPSLLFSPLSSFSFREERMKRKEVDRGATAVSGFASPSFSLSSSLL